MHISFNNICINLAELGKAIKLYQSYVLKLLAGLDKTMKLYI